MTFTRRIALILLMSLLVGAALFLALAWRAEWIPHLIVNETLQHPEHKNWTFKFEVRRQRESRHLWSLFSKEFEPLKSYDFRIVCGSTVITSASYLFEVAEPSTGKVSWQNSNEFDFPGTVLFDMGAGSSIICTATWGGTIVWRRVDDKEPRSAVVH